MNEIESRLRALLDIAVGDPPRRVTVEAVRRAVVRRKIVASAVAAMALVLAGGVALAGQPGAPGRPHKPGVPPLAKVTTGVPRYYVAGASTSRGDETTVRATATGAVRAIVRCPWRAVNVRPWPVAPAASQTFFLVCQQATRPAGYATFLESRIYQFQVTSAGRVSGYRLVRGGVLPGLRVGAITVTPDGSEIAAIIYPGTLANISPKTPADVLVINARTGAQATWHAAAPTPGNVVYYPQQISLTASGQELAFLTQPQCFGSHCTFTPGAGEQIRVVGAAAGGQLNNSRVLTRFPPILRRSSVSVVAALLSPDGSRLTLTVVGDLSGNSVSVVQVPAAGGGPLRFLYRLATSNGSYMYGFFSADPSGRHFLIGAGGPGGIAAGWIDHGRLIHLKPAAYQVAFEVW